MDIVYVGIVVVFFVLTWGLLKLCEILGQPKSGGTP
jgi:hypothetical protein